MKPARQAKRLYENTKLLVFNRDQKIEHTNVASLAERFDSGDLLIVNRSATLPSAYQGRIERSGEKVEIRLGSFIGADPSRPASWSAVVFLPGHWRQKTEERIEAPKVTAGDVIRFAKELSMKILEVREERLVKVEFVAGAVSQSKFLSLLYKHGRPIQYSYLKEDLEVWDQQTLFSGPPISVEAPSASFNLNWKLLFEIQKRGVRVAPILHSAGLSSTGDPRLDQFLPLPEYFEIPEPTARLYAETRAEKKRVIAAGTTVLRALESAYSKAEGLLPGPGLATIKIKPEDSVTSVNELITGMHEPESSHMRILKAFCPMALLEEGYRQAQQRKYFGHEYGDLSLVQCGCA